MDAEDDELYSGYDDDAGAGAAAAASPAFTGAESASPGAPPSTGGGMAAPGTAGGRVGTAMGSDGMARPMTSNRGAGFSSAPRAKFDPLGGPGRSALAANGPSSLLPRKGKASPEEAARDMERRVHALLEDSAAAHARGEQQQALEKALEARKRERALTKFRDANSVADYGGPELTFAAEFQVAAMYAANRLWQEALDGYTALLKNKQQPQGARLRINIGNVYFEQGKLPPAIKAYRMALDTLPASAGPQRARLLRNIGLAFVRMGQYADAAAAYEAAVGAQAEHQAAYHLVLCCYALGDMEGMRAAFSCLVSSPELPPEADGGSNSDDSDGDDEHAGGHARGRGRGRGGAGAAGAGPRGGADRLREEERRRRALVQERVLTAAQLVAERMDRDGPAAAQQGGGGGSGGGGGFDWCVEQLRASGHPLLAAEVALSKAGRFLAARDVAGATAVFKAFENKESSLR
ncbi:putative Intraflagellar transport protein [Monoraphidium neglectum]|uniref:Putative Intraflagellar transport protein n=1 Tax=Monoraphidium neglectum TaxID=145388 RepID=A0A0D2MDE3_9CHLO|nr:putative Intraflagellar transport protein [Monoraphidium neglectum]KIZ01185.1 putative Intraflagellar transport protein [Monoraphidium neglectum]|eukprot:XP_013900204.1 putative Intraflagellar transport protein [Monoraphidium neglectum]